MSADLRSIVAALAKVPVADIKEEFSLQIPVLANSIKKAVLVASIRRDLGVDCMEAAFAKTFGELERLVADKKAGRTPSAAGLPVLSAPEDLGLSCGIDLETFEHLPQAADFASHEFYRANFTEAEIAYCSAQAAPRAHFAARWCAKEALRKCDAAFAREPFNLIEVEREASGRVFLRRQGPGGASRLPHAVSLSHTDAAAAAVVVRKN